MRKFLEKKVISFLLAGVSILTITNVQAHSGGATMNPAGNNPHFMAVVDVTCFDDGNGAPDHLSIRIEDTSPYVEGSQLTFLVYKANRAISTSDPIPADGQYGPLVKLHAGGGRYTMMLNTTGPGPRNFIAEWHCVTADEIHTGTSEIVVRQYN